MKKIKKNHKTPATKKVQEPISSRIAKAVYEAKRISERIVGYVSYDIKFVRATYNGKTQRPAKITALEKGIVGILLVDESSSFEKIGSILGLDVVNDKAEQSILRNKIDLLKGFGAIEGDDSCYALTTEGRVYADKGERPDSYTKSFDIFVDVSHPSWLDIKNGIGENSKNIVEINTPCDDINLDLETIKSYAENQAQDVHFPQNRYLLESATWHSGHEASYKVYVCFVQNVANSDDVRAFVFDENTNNLNDVLANYINRDFSLKEELLNNCIHYEIENNEETTILEGDDVEVAKSEISEEIKEAELKIIKEESGEIDDNSEEESALSPSNELSGTITRVPAKERLHKKALYDSLSFEVELQKIFTEDDPDEVWLISPWIRKGAFLHDRGPMIEDFLCDENKRVFIAYSEPATNNDGKPMMDEEVEPGIKLLDEQYPNFFYVQLPEFHLKNVIEVKGDQKVLFSGSFNVLSFSVSDQQTHVRREEMALAHHSVARKKYEDCQLEFAEIYANRIRKEIEQLDFNMLANYKNERFEYFLKIDNEVIRKLFSPLEDMLEEKAYERIKSEVNKKLVKIGQELVAASNISGLNPKEKKRLTSMLTTIESEMQNNSIDDPSMQELLNNNKELLEKIREKKIFPGKPAKISGVNSQPQTQKPVSLTPITESISVSKITSMVSDLMDGNQHGTRITLESVTMAKKMCSPINLSLENTDKLFKVLSGANVLASAIKLGIERKMRLADVHNSLRRVIKKSDDFENLSIIYNESQKRIIFDLEGIQFQYEKFEVNDEIRGIINAHNNRITRWNGSRTFLFSTEILDIAIKYVIE
ncbi:MAG: hypothetical protein IJE12_11650 [Prevotella sp.]|nr:hypothetical protein [Prevotella sp.]